MPRPTLDSRLPRHDVPEGSPGDLETWLNASEAAVEALDTRLAAHIVWHEPDAPQKTENVVLYYTVFLPPGLKPTRWPPMLLQV